jgi:hypothetical protein
VSQSQLITLSEIKDVARKFLQLRLIDEDMIDVAMATYIANKFDGDPLWIFLNGPPSNAKIEILMSMKDHEMTFFLSTVTRNTFMSGKVDKSGKDPSLLPRMTNKLVIIKDFTSLLSLQKDARNEIYSQFREIYDGRYDKGAGSGVHCRSWSGKIGIVAGVTPAIDGQWSVSAMLGERFLHFRCGGGNRGAAAKTAIRHSTGMKQHRQELRDIVTKFLKQLDRIKTAELNPLNTDMEDRLITLAIFCATARTSVDRHLYTQNIEVYPEPEGPARLTKQLHILANGLAVVRNKNEVDEDIYQVVKKVARDSMPKLRFRILKALWELYEYKNN